MSMDFYEKIKAKEQNAKKTLKVSIQEREATDHLNLFRAGPGLRAVISHVLEWKEPPS